MKNNVNKKEINKSCILCGNCSAVCPKNAIKYDNLNEKVIINENLCINCGLCVRNCPMEKWQDNKTKTLLGNVEGVYAGYSNDELIRFKSASGGLLTQTLKYLIENNIVDKVLITDFKEDSMQSESHFSNDIEEIINACGSKYQIVNINKALKTVLKEDLRYAYVGLPCHHKGLKKLTEMNPMIKNRIVYKFAICCSHNCNIEVLDYVTHYLNIKNEDIKSIKYRGDGWPEYLTITTQEDEKIKFPVKIWNYLFLSFFYTPRQCFECDDFCGENSDISFADAWLNEYTSKKSDGYNLVFSHNTKGEELLKHMLESNAVNLSRHTYIDIINSQIIGLFYKKCVNQTKNPMLLVLKNILKFNSFVSRQRFFKFVKPLILRYYFFVLNIIFLSRELKKYKENLINENCNS